MSYHPYLRGKLNELMLLRENPKLFKDANFIPIIEPVKESMAGLKKALDALSSENVESVLIVNPYHGHHSKEELNKIEDFFNAELGEMSTISAGIILTQDLEISDIEKLADTYKKKPITLIHNGFTNAKNLVEKLGRERVAKMRHIFLDEECGKLYRRNFANDQRVLTRDGFKKQMNRNYPFIELFSDLHVTYKCEEGMNGFGDFLIVGDDYTETGGLPTVIAIHLTFIDPEQDDQMFIYHFLSESDRDKQANPAGKFGEAVKKLVEESKKPNTKIFKTEALKEFIDLHERGHFPGLGYIKKLSMKHHIETLATFLKSNA